MFIYPNFRINDIIDIYMIKSTTRWSNPLQSYVLLQIIELVITRHQSWTTPVTTQARGEIMPQFLREPLGKCLPPRRNETNRIEWKFIPN